MPGRFDRSLRNMDANALDADGRWRLSTAAKMDYAFWNTLLAGWVGWALCAICAALFAALLVWLFT